MTKQEEKAIHDMLVELNNKMRECEFETERWNRIYSQWCAVAELQRRLKSL